MKWRRILLILDILPALYQDGAFQGFTQISKTPTGKLINAIERFMEYIFIIPASRYFLADLLNMFNDR
jgi:hypothetical protein